MTFASSKAMLTELREWAFPESTQAFDIALWLCDWHAAIKAGEDMIAWETEHPRPGSKGT